MPPISCCLRSEFLLDGLYPDHLLCRLYCARLLCRLYCARLLCRLYCARLLCRLYCARLQSVLNGPNCGITGFVVRIRLRYTLWAWRRADIACRPINKPNSKTARDLNCTERSYCYRPSGLTYKLSDVGSRSDSQASLTSDMWIGMLRASFA
jgi:hypothetical protein